MTLIAIGSSWFRHHYAGTNNNLIYMPVSKIQNKPFSL